MFARLAHAGLAAVHIILATILLLDAAFAHAACVAAAAVIYAALSAANHDGNRGGY
jgi:hypothetical protein